MSINAQQLKQYIIIPTLKDLDLYSESAVNLLLGTSAVESDMGTYLVQHGGGPAKGIYMMERNTFNDIWVNYILIGENEKIKRLRYELVNYGVHCFHKLTYDFNIATAMTRIHYLRIKEKLPDANDIEGMARYWKKYYNTKLGKGKEQDFIDKYKKYVI